MMKQEAIAVFDIGKTNKKILLFDKGLSLIQQEEEKFKEIQDDDGYACDDLERIESWMIAALEKMSQQYEVKAVNFSTYGATLMYLDADGKRLTPAYNYLKPMPDDVLEGFYEKYGGVNEFCRQTASPALGMLNSGLQILWLKKKKPGIYAKVAAILHFRQYLSGFFTKQKISEYTSIGCHTAMWDFDHMQYHRWLSDEGIRLPDPVANTLVYPVESKGKKYNIGTGIHDSSASLAPYLMGSSDPFILISTGTWCIFMNPFNEEPLTADQLGKDTLCYMSVNQKQGKSSRLFMGHIHDVNVERLSAHFGVDTGSYKKVKYQKELLKQKPLASVQNRVFFSNDMPEDYIDGSVDLSRFTSFEAAYHQLVCDLVSLSLESLELIIPQKDETRAVYISGGFARNEIYVKLLAGSLPGKKVYTSEVDNATALGAAIMVWEEAFGKDIPRLDLGLEECTAD